MARPPRDHFLQELARGGPRVTVLHPHLGPHLQRSLQRGQQPLAGQAPVGDDHQPGRHYSTSPSMGLDAEPYALRGDA